jgi:uncharacterized protein YbjT (DUF2867 family)
MRVFLAGGAGVIGQRLIPELVAAGREVTATTRSPAGMERLRALGATPAVMDGLDRDQVLTAVGAARPEVIIHQMTALTGLSSLRHFDHVFAMTNELRTRGTGNPARRQGDRGAHVGLAAARLAGPVPRGVRLARRPGGEGGMTDD